MKIKLLLVNIWVILSLISCNSGSTPLLDIPEKGRIAYIIETQPPFSQEEEVELSFLNTKLDGEMPYHPEKPSTFITTNAKSKTTEKYIIRFEKKVSKKISILTSHNLALSEMTKLALRNGYITSFTLHTIIDTGKKRTSIYSKKTGP